MTATAASITTVLAGVLRGARRRHRELLGLQRTWARLVSQRVAEHARPVSLYRGRLVVHVDRPGENFMLSFERVRLLERLRRATKGGVTDLVLRPGEIPKRTAPRTPAPKPPHGMTRERKRRT